MYDLKEKNMHLEEYCIYSAIRKGFPFSRMTTNNQISPMKLSFNRVLPFLNNLEDLDPSYKMYSKFFPLLVEPTQKGRQK